HRLCETSVVLTAYLKELQKIALLRPEDEQQLWYQYRIQKDAESRLRLIEAYQPLVFKLVMQIRPPDVVLMDMLQEGTVGLIEAVERFDPSRGVRFSTFAAYRVRGRVLNSLRRIRPVEYSLEQDGQSEMALATRLADPESDHALLDVEDDAMVAQVWRDRAKRQCTEGNLTRTALTLVLAGAEVHHAIEATGAPAGVGTRRSTPFAFVLVSAVVASALLLASRWPVTSGAASSPPP